MRIEKKRIRSLEANLANIRQGASVIIGADVASVSLERLLQIGFTGELSPGQTLLPAALGAVSRYNAEGKVIIHRDQPKETCHRQHEWTYYQWHGQDRVEVTKVVEIPYERYPRSQVPPPAIEVSLARAASGDLIAAFEASNVDYENPEPLLHKINLTLELFGHCHVMDISRKHVIVSPTIRLNWDILPQGKMPWAELRPAVESVLRANRPNANAVVEYRLETVNGYAPEFVAVGRGGFVGYVIFGFPERGLFILETSKQGNATYVFGNDWEQLSQMSKAEILNGELHLHRLIHVANWEKQLASIMKMAS